MMNKLFAAAALVAGPVVVGVIGLAHFSDKQGPIAQDNFNQLVSRSATGRLSPECQNLISDYAIVSGGTRVAAASDDVAEFNKKATSCLQS